MHVLLKHISKYGILFIIVAEGFSHSSKCHRQITCRLKVDLNIFDEFSGNVKQEKCTLLNSICTLLNTTGGQLDIYKTCF